MMKLRIDNDGADADIMVCTLATDPTPFSDNVRGVCSGCGVGIQWRPHAPSKPKKVCIPCGMAAIEDDPDPDVMVTSYTADEFTRYFRRRGKH